MTTSEKPEPLSESAPERENEDSQLALAMGLLAKSIGMQAHQRYFKAAQDYAATYEEEVDETDTQLPELLGAIRAFKPDTASFLRDRLKPSMSNDAFKGFVLLVAGTLRSEKAVQTPFEDSWLVLQLFEGSRFHQNLLSNHFKETEGFGCSVDKARTVIKALCHGAIYGQYPTFNYEGEYTFHLPKDSLKTPEQLKIWGNLACRAFAGDIMPLARFKQSLSPCGDTNTKDAK